MGDVTGRRFCLLSLCLTTLSLNTHTVNAYLPTHPLGANGAKTLDTGGFKVTLDFADGINEITTNITTFLKQGGFAEMFQHVYSEASASPTDICVYGISNTCCNDTIQFLKDLAQRKNYAEQMMDAAAKLPSGLLQGKKTWVGSYDECVNALSPANNLTGHQIGGKYCMGATAIGIPGQYLMQGVCVPNTCTALDLNIWVAEIYSFLKEPDQTGMACEESMPYTAGAKAALAVCGVIVLLVTIGTIVDLVVTFNERRQKSSNSYVILVEDNETTGRTSVLSNETSSSGQIQSQRLNPPQPNRGKICQVAVAFSIVTNTRKLLSTSTSSGHLTSLNGMRVLSMFWIILGHTYLFASLGMTVENSLAAVKIIQRFSFQAIINATVSVDTFFFMSGLLVTYLYLKNRQESTDSFNWVLFYFHRYWRLTPVYAFCIMIWGSLFFHTLRGPMAVWRSTPQTQALINECSKSWWANILYINNYYPYSGDINQQCMGWSWYLANDMQFYIISPIILILLYRYRKIGFAVCGGLIGACIFIRAMTAFEFGIHVPNQAVTKHKDNYYGQHAPLYNKMYTRIAPYIVGMLLGYALHKTNCRVRMSKVTVLTGWSVAIATGLSVVYGLYDYYYHSFNASLAISVIYLAFNRFAWSVALAWVVFACATGYGGLVNSILSWSAWAPLGRLTYCAYLIHPMILEFFFFQPYAYIVSDVNMICYYLGLLVLTYMCAYIVSMAVEAPMLGLEKILIPLMEKAINTLIGIVQDRQGSCK